MFGLTESELKVLKRLSTPNKIQDYLDAIPINHEKRAETCFSPRRVIIEQKAHCLEGALLAAVALWLQGEEPLLLNLKVARGDFDHAVTLYKRGGYWGAISKTNHSVLRFRDPIYRDVRELALSYFHEYFLVTNGRKTLRGYLGPIDLKEFGTEWITAKRDLWKLAGTIYDMKHTPIVPKGNERFIRPAHPLEQIAAGIKEWHPSDQRT
jgi:hypothetical protein